MLDTLKWLKPETDVWFEITNLMIPQANDSAEEFQRMCDWILEHVGDEVPLHFTAFHPDYRMRDRGPTPPETLIAARETALAAGLKYVYVGNVNDAPRQSTYCPNCKKRVIERNWYELGEYALNGPNCRHCGTRIAGHFDRETRRLGPQAVAGGHAAICHSLRFADPRTIKDGRVPHDGIYHAFGPADARSIRTSRTGGGPAHQSREFESLARTSPPPICWGHENIELAKHPVSGVFVTAKRHGQLRSCCGNVGQVMPLAESLTQAAVRTATDDPRFPPISPNELPYLDLDVWLLGPTEEIEEQGEARIGAVTIGEHGLQVDRHGQRGLLLPSVAIENNWDAEEFLNRVCMKAGLPASAWREDDVKLFRFAGTEHVGKVLSETEAANWPAMPGLFSPRDIAAYAQFCGESLRTLMQGATPLYYCPSISDGNINGISLRVNIAGTTQEIISTRLNLKQSMPLQATMFSLCEELARVLANNRIPPHDVNLSMTVLFDPNLHGTVANPDLTGIGVGERAILVSEANRRAWIFDDDKSPQSLLEEAAKLCEVTEPAMALVMSLRAASSRSRGQVVDRPRAVAGPAIRPPAVAGTFYPGTAEEINRMLDDFFAEDKPRLKWSAAMVPHAGWKYSGQIAADVLAQIEFPETVILIGPKHTPNGVDWAVAPHAKWALPNGNVNSDPELARQLAERIPGLKLDAAAHQTEHGIEVELPMIHRLAPHTKVVGITLGSGSLARLQDFAEHLAEVIGEQEEPPLLIISSDMNHFATDAETRRLDELALAEMDKLDPEGLFKTAVEHHISMCGMRPAVIILNALKRLEKLNESRRVGYATTADVSGEKSRVVGYAGMLFR